MIRGIARLGLTAKATLLVIGSLLVLSATSLSVVIAVMTVDGNRAAAARQQDRINVAWHVLRGEGDSFRIAGGTLFAGARRLDGATATVEEIRALAGGDATVFRDDVRVATTLRAAEGGPAVGTRMAAGPVRDTVLGEGRPYRGYAEELGRAYFVAYDPLKDASGKVIGAVGVGVPATEVTGAIVTMVLALFLATLPVFFVVGGIAYLASRRMFGPLHRIRDAMSRLAEGHADVAIPGRNSSEEIRRMAAALETFRDAHVARVRAETEAHQRHDEQMLVIGTFNRSLERLSAGDLTADVQAEFPADYASLKGNFNVALAALRDLIGAVTEITEAIRSGSGEIAQASQDLARRSESNAATLEQTTAAVGQMDERLKGIAHAAGRTVERADTALGDVDAGRSVAEQAVQAMGRVAESAKGIDGVIEGLDKIAFQTRVLAMNAAVEAGRAGEAGRGFAVVADLVSALAMRAEEEAKRARDQLTLTQDDVGMAVTAVRDVDQALDRIVHSVGEVHRLLATIANDNVAQSSAVSQITTAISAMDRTTQQNAAMVEETSAAALHLRQQVDALAGMADRFTVGASNRVPGAGADPFPTPPPDRVLH